MDPEYYYHTNYSITQKAARPTIFPHLQIKFNLSLNKEYANYLINSETGHRHLPLPSTHRSATTALIVARDHISFDAVREAVGAAIGDSLRAYERRHAILLAWERLLGVLSPVQPLPKYVQLEFDMVVSTRYFYVHGERSDDDDGSSGMVPAAEEEIRMLEECDVAEEERCCSICLEELGVALRMPCSHVFHRGCIKKWLRKSHYCPLCRYQMPTTY